MRVNTSSSGKTFDVRSIEPYTLTSGNGLELQATAYGAAVTSLKVPDRSGRLGDVVLGFAAPERYFDGSPFFGAIIGRYANRIARGQFTLGGRTYKLATNDGVNHLHGGRKGFDKVVWTAERLQGRAGVAFTRTSPDGEEGYPGNLEVRVTYTVTDRNELVVEYSATSDKPTAVNLTQHSYFNLAADISADTLEHKLRINADHYTPVDETLIPTGELAPVEGTPFDFRSPTAIGSRISRDHAQLRFGDGYDHNWVLNRAPAGLHLAARVAETRSGRTLEVFTDQPGLQFYSGNALDGTIIGKYGHVYNRHSGFCLETQHYPDSPNQPHFPTTIVNPGQEYRTKTVFAFGTTAERQ